MASIIRIKRSSTSGNPATLAAGELAYSALSGLQNNGGDRLYVGIGAETSGNAANHFVVGGKYFTDMLDHVQGTLTADSAIVTDSSNKINNLKVDNLDLDGNTITSTDANGNIVLDPNGTGYVSITGTNGLVIPVGTTAQRSPNVQGTIRFNSETSSFEGYSGSTWGSLGGVKSVDGLTFISAESAPGASNDTLSFVTNNVERMSLDTDSLDISNTILTTNIDATTASSNTTTGALVVDGGVGIAGNLNVGGTVNMGAASFTSINNTPIGNTTPSTGAFTQLDVDNIRVDGNTITSTDANGDITLTPNGTGDVILSADTIKVGDVNATATITTNGVGNLILNTNQNDASSGSITIATGANQDITVAPNGTGKTVLNNVFINGTSDSLAEFIYDTVGGATTGGTGITVTNNDGSNTSTISITNTAVTAGSYGSSTAIPTFTVNAQGQLTAAGTANVATTLNITADTGTNDGVALLSETLNIAGGEGIDTVVSNNTITIAGEDASTTNKGIASFDTSNFTVTSGAVSTKNITLGSSTLTNGSTTNSIAGLLQLDVDNIQIDGNSIISTNANGGITLDPNGTGHISASNALIKDVASPVDGNDAANKAYVDAVAEGLHVHASVKAATVANLVGTYNNGAGTYTLSAALNTLDGYSLVNGDRILIKDQTNAFENGIYVRTSSTVFTRAVDFNSVAEIASGDFLFVTNGTINGNTGWVQTIPMVTIGVTSILFNQFAGVGTYIAGAGLLFTGNVLDIVLKSDGGLEIVSDELGLKSSTAGDGLTFSAGVLNVGGTANRISVSADSIDIAATYVGQSSITTLGTIATGTWNGSTIAAIYGGTGQSTYAIGDILVGAAANTLNKLTLGGSGTVLQSNGTTLVYGDVDGGTY